MKRIGKALIMTVPTALMLLAVPVIRFQAQGQVVPPRPRFEQIYEESVGHSTFSVYHDKESGQEFVCNYGLVDSARTCWPSGRSWK